MKKVMVIGCPGSGKSTFSKTLNKKTNIPLYHLDMLNWKSDRTTVEKSVFIERLNKIIQKEKWIIDGDYGSTIEIRLQACDTVIFLDYPLEVCLSGIKERNGKKRTDIPWVEPENEVDYEFIEFIKNFRYNSRPNIIQLLKKYKDRTILIFKSREEANKYLENI